MSPRSFASPLGSFFLISILSARAGAQPLRVDLERGDSLFREGRFEDAAQAYRQVLDRAPASFRAQLLLGQIALLGNHLDEAQQRASRALELAPDDPIPRSLLAEVFYRRDELERAAPLLRAAGREAKARKLESFRGVPPYDIGGERDATRLPFVQTDALPVVEVRVNGGGLANFIIDTGASEVILDPRFARDVGAREFGSEVGTFAGGLKSTFVHGTVDSLALGDFVVRHVPVQLLDTRPLAAVAGGRQVDGIIGTVLLYHFLATLDYPGGALVLRRRTAQNLARFEKEAGADAQTVVPFWMAGDHFVVAWGSVNGRAYLLFVDTGLAGLAFTCPESTVKEAGIEIVESRARVGTGGGGKLSVVPFVLTELALADAVGRDVAGVFGPFPPSLEHNLGFRIGGLISHGFFRGHALTLDFTGMRLFLRPSS
ncbi:MAG: aspartyl protease family protein [Gemmatimonadetes bacterium]|nr:aspartyl protease family protein [Gemmatimonadota bacterium]